MVDPDIDEVYHLTHFALDGDAKDKERVVVSVENDEGKFVIGTLTKGSCDQFSTDLLGGWRADLPVVLSTLRVR